MQAALDLCTGQGYDRTTVSEIADRVGVTSRTSASSRKSARCCSPAGQVIGEAIVAATSGR